MTDAARIVVAKYEFGNLASLEGNSRVAQFRIAVEMERLLLRYKHSADLGRIASV